MKKNLVLSKRVTPVFQEYGEHLYQKYVACLSLTFLDLYHYFANYI
jgi:hypothetical protein